MEDHLGCTTKRAMESYFEIFRDSRQKKAAIEKRTLEVKDSRKVEVWRRAEHVRRDRRVQKMCVPLQSGSREQRRRDRV